MRFIVSSLRDRQMGAFWSCEHSLRDLTELLEGTAISFVRADIEVQSLQFKIVCKTGAHRLNAATTSNDLFERCD